MSDTVFTQGVPTLPSASAHVSGTGTDATLHEKSSFDDTDEKGLSEPERLLLTIAT